MMAEEALPAEAVTEMIAEAIDLVVHLRLDPAGARRVVTNVYEVTGLEGDTVAGSDLFSLREGMLTWTGIRPRFAGRLHGGGCPWEHMGQEPDGSGSDQSGRGLDR
jgi:hypothetical protein